MKLAILLSLLFSSLVGTEPFFTAFNPPEGWLIADPTQVSDGIKIGFIQSKRRLFTPSISLTSEQIGNASFETYLTAVKRAHTGKAIADLGTFSSPAGEGHLLQIDFKNQWGEIRLLQAITLKDGYALIQTASCLKEDFLEVHETFLQAFQSLAVYPTLFDSCTDPEFQSRVEGLKKSFKKYRKTSKNDPKILFQSSFFQSNQWIPFVNYLENHLKSKGACWQLLAIQHIQETLITENAT